ncbi:hypothetical protein ACS0TY_030294 [Phlomoides rotata]
MSACSSFSNAEGSGVLCKCLEEARLRTSWTDVNPGRRFYGCRYWGVNGGGCDFFKWFDGEMSGRARTLILNLLREKNIYKVLKHEKEQYDGKFWKYSLVGSWVFFFAIWLSKF